VIEKRRQAVKDYAYKVVGKSFSWGKCDCHTLAVDVYCLITGDDKRGLVYNHYSNAQEALAYSKRCGGFAKAILAERLQYKPNGGEEIGDFLISKAPDGNEQVHVCVGGSVLACSVSKGVRLHPLSAYKECYDYEVVCINER